MKKISILIGPLLKNTLILAIMTTGACSVTKTDSLRFDRDALANTMENSIRKEMLDVWYPRCVDSVHGGFLSGFSHDWQPKGDQRKMIVTQSRHTWVNAKASQRYPDEAHFARGAEHGFRFLRDVMWDKTHGGFYAMVSRDGQVIDSAKNAYGNSFGIFALAAYYEASKDTLGLRLAKDAFVWLEKNSHDPVHGGYFQHMNRDGSRIERTASTDSKAETGYKDQNSSIHLLEAFTELYQVWPDPLVRERLQEMVVLIRDTITNDKGSLTLFLTREWNPVSFQDSSREVIEEHHNLDHVSFGHDVETAYLLMEASHVLGIKNDTTTLRKTKKMVDHSLRTGWDDSVGGFYDGGYYFKGDTSLTVIRWTKNWWAQAEGLNTLLIMADTYPEDEMNYGSKFLKLWNYIDQNLIDHEHGGWYEGGLDKQPEKKTADKGHIWKGCYHDFRALDNSIRGLRDVH